MRMQYDLDDLKRLFDEDLAKYGQRTKSIQLKLEIDIIGISERYTITCSEGVEVETEAIPQ